jgi:hypothetical protein
MWAAGEPLFRRYTRNIEATEPENLSVYSIAAQERSMARVSAQACTVW